jgi:hypothetical protein
MLVCDAWWRPTVVRFACCDVSLGTDFPEGEAALAVGEWELLQAVECSGQSNGPECEFSLELVAPSSAGDAAVRFSGRICAVWDEEMCEGALFVGQTVDELIASALAAHEDRRLNSLAADVCASVSVMHCLSIIDLLSAAHENLQPFKPPDADFTAPTGDVHMRGVLPVTRRPASSLKLPVSETSNHAKPPAPAKPHSAKSTPRLAEAPPQQPIPLPLLSLAQINITRPATAHPARKQHDSQLLDPDDVASLHSGDCFPHHRTSPTLEFCDTPQKTVVIKRIGRSLPPSKRLRDVPQAQMPQVSSNKFARLSVFSTAIFYIHLWFSAAVFENQFFTKGSLRCAAPCEEAVKLLPNKRSELNPI